MKDIILPSETSDAIDLGAIDDNTEGIIISYKGNVKIFKGMIMLKNP